MFRIMIGVFNGVIGFLGGLLLAAFFIYLFFIGFIHYWSAYNAN